VTAHGKLEDDQKLIVGATARCEDFVMVAAASACKVNVSFGLLIVILA
jgi:hypothetical protein